MPRFVGAALENTTWTVTTGTKLPLRIAVATNGKLTEDMHARTSMKTPVSAIGSESSIFPDDKITVSSCTSGVTNASE
jgi:hypothetical protein